MSQRIALLVLLLISVGVRANTQDLWTGNWLLGISGGYADRIGSPLQSTISFQGPYVPSNFPETLIQRHYSDAGLIWGLVGGYQKISRKWLTGLELTVDQQTITQDHPYAFSDPQNRSSWNANSRYVSNYQLGFSARAGYAFSQYMMPYVRFGFSFGIDRLETTFTPTPDTFGVSTLPDAYITTRHWVHRFLLGAGMEMPLPRTCGLTLRLEYDIYSKGRTLKPNGQLLDGFTDPVFASALQPYVQTGRITLVKNFF